MTTMQHKIDLDLPKSSEPISAEVLDDDECVAFLLFAHGAGAGMHHPFMVAMSNALLAQQIATIRFQFPYMEKGRRAPDRQNVLVPCIEQASHWAQAHCRQRPLFVGGKSMGGRMASIAAADKKLAAAAGIIFFGFPLHASGKPSQKRAAHLTDVEQPMLFIQGTRDRLADINEIQSVCNVLGDAVSLAVLDGADHSFGFLKSSQRDPADVFTEVASIAGNWCKDTISKRTG